MIRCNLSDILKEKGIKISQVSRDTGISRTTLTSLSNNNSKGIQYDTMSKLCAYLNIEPSELFYFDSYEIKVDLNLDMDKNTQKYAEYLDKGIDFSFLVRLKENMYSEYKTFKISVKVLCVKEEVFCLSLVKHLKISCYLNSRDNNISEYLKELPYIFFREIELKVVEEVTKIYEKINFFLILDMINKNDVAVKDFINSYCLKGITHDFFWYENREANNNFKRDI